MQFVCIQSLPGFIPQQKRLICWNSTNYAGREKNCVVMMRKALEDQPTVSKKDNLLYLLPLPPLRTKG